MSLGRPFGGRRPVAEIDWKRLDREYDIPRIVTRFDGADNVWNIVRRSDAPGGQEKPPVLEVELAIPQLPKPEKQAVGKDREAFLAEPVLAIGEQSVRFPVRLMDGQRLVCRDQATWRVLGADGAEVAVGQVAGTFPTLLPGANRVTLASQAQPTADFRVIVKTVKVYR